MTGTRAYYLSFPSEHHIRHCYESMKCYIKRRYGQRIHYGEDDYFEPLMEELGSPDTPLAHALPMCW